MRIRLRASDRHQTAVSPRHRLAFCLILLVAVLLRLLLILAVDHPNGDVQTFMRWARGAQARGLSTIYSSPGIDYPPFSICLFAVAGWIEARLPGSLRACENWLILLLRLPAIFADVITALLVVWPLRDGDSRERTFVLIVCAIYLFNPAVWYVSGYWGQTDSVYSLLLLICVMAMKRRASTSAWLAYALAIATKLQSIALAPLLILWTFAKRGIRGVAAGLAASAALGTIIVLPWLITGHLRDVLERAFFGLPSETSRVTVSGFNLWYLILMSRVSYIRSDVHPASLPFSYQTIGMGLFGAFGIVVAVLAVRRSHPPALPAATLSLGMFMLLTQMHERHMFAAIPLILLAAVEQTIGSGSQTSNGEHPRRPGVSLWWAYGTLSLTFFFNLITVMPFTTALGTNLVAASADSTRVVVLKLVSLLAAAVNLSILAWLVFTLGSRTHNDARRALVLGASPI